MEIEPIDSGRSWVPIPAAQTERRKPTFSSRIFPARNDRDFPVIEPNPKTEKQKNEQIQTDRQTKTDRQTRERLLSSG